MKHSNFTEKVIILKAKKGNKQAFAQIYDWYVKKIYQFVFFKTNTKELAEDITQDVFLKLINYLDEQKTIKSLQALLYQIARNLVNDYYRNQHNKIQTDLETVDQLQHVSIDPQEELNNFIEIENSIGVIKNSLDQLKMEYREVIILKFIEELTHREIADILNKKEGHVRVLLHRAIAELRQALKATKVQSINHKNGKQNI